MMCKKSFYISKLQLTQKSQWSVTMSQNTAARRQRKSRFRKKLTTKFTHMNPAEIEGLVEELKSEWYESKRKVTVPVTAPVNEEIVPVIPIIMDEVEDTRGWSWKRWAKFFLNIDLFDFQIEVLEQFDKEMSMLNLPRQGRRHVYSSLKARQELNNCRLLYSKKTV